MPFLILGVGALAVLMIGLLGPIARERVVPSSPSPRSWPPWSST